MLQLVFTNYAAIFVTVKPDYIIMALFLDLPANKRRNKY